MKGRTFHITSVSSKLMVGIFYVNCMNSLLQLGELECV